MSQSNVIPSETLQLISEIENQIFNMQSLKSSGTITGVDIVIDELGKKEFQLKEALVLAVHTHKITEMEITKHGKLTKCWQTRTNNKIRPRCYSYEKLIEKLFALYFGKEVLSDYSFKSLFIAALNEKIATENPKSKTIKDYWNSYHAFITDEFGAKDIRRITPSEIKIYIQEVTQRLKPTLKRFYKFKGILNLVFRFSTDAEHRYIEINPVPELNYAYMKNCTSTSNKPEDKAFQPEEVELIRTTLWKRVSLLKYDVNGYAILFASETGCREGEIPAIKWTDISEKCIHIHAQQNDHIVDGHKEYYYNPTTKNERGISTEGREIPMTDAIRSILSELRAKQKSLGISSEWVFAKENSEWITTAGYSKALYRLCKKLGLKLSNNHAFRMSLNSYVYIPAGLNETTRAAILGHSVETNLRRYSFTKSEYLDEVTEVLNAFRMAVT